MLDPRHRTKLPRIKEALDVFGKCLVVSVEEADWPFQLSSPRGARPRRAVSALLPTQASYARRSGFWRTRAGLESCPTTAHRMQKLERRATADPHPKRTDLHCSVAPWRWARRRESGLSAYIR